MSYKYFFRSLIIKNPCRFKKVVFTFDEAGVTVGINLCQANRSRETGMVYELKQKVKRTLIIQESYSVQKLIARKPTRQFIPFLFSYIIDRQ